jgi:hypothetical protein
VNALLRWYRAGLDVEVKLPLLATYLGHGAAVSTHYYLHFIEPLRAAGKRAVRESLWRTGLLAAEGTKEAWMKTGPPNLLGAAIRDYFTDHLPRLRGTSPHTIHSYRDSMVLLLRRLGTLEKHIVVRVGAGFDALCRADREVAAAISAPI